MMENNESNRQEFIDGLKGIAEKLRQAYDSFPATFKGHVNDAEWRRYLEKTEPLKKHAGRFLLTLRFIESHCPQDFQQDPILRDAKSIMERVDRAYPIIYDRHEIDRFEEECRQLIELVEHNGYSRLWDEHTAGAGAEQKEIEKLIPIVKLRDIVPRSTIPGEVKHMRRWLERRGVTIQKIGGRNNANKADLLQLILRAGTEAYNRVKSYPNRPEIE